MDTSSDAGLVLEERHGPVTVVQLNRPEALNALSPELISTLIGTLERLDRDRDVRAVVIAGHDRAFMAGADIKSMRERPLAEILTQESNKFYFRLAALEVPLVAAVSGWAFGGGCELALACDLVVASETAVFSQAEITVGIMPGGGGTQRLARTIGKHRAMEMVLTGRKVTAEEAARLGFVNRVVPAGTWRDAALDMATEIAGMPPMAVKMAKRAVLAAEESTLSAGMVTERRLMELTFATEDRVEGMSAFVERRPPRWAGK